MLPRITEGSRFMQPVEQLLWVLFAAIITVVAISAVVFIAECICEWRSSPEETPNNPFCGYISRRIKRRRSRLA